MIGFTYACKIINSFEIIIMLFIRFAPNCDFMRRNHQRRTRLKRPFRLCSHLIGSYNINTGPETNNTMLTLFVTYSRLRSMMNLLLRIISNIMLGLFLSLRFTTMRRKQVLLRIQLQRRMVGLLGATAIDKKMESYQS